MRCEMRISQMKLEMLIDFMQWKWCSDSGGGSDGKMVRDVNIGKWSEGETGEWLIEGDRVESLGMMTKSRVCPSWWVGNLTCWMRLVWSGREKLLWVRVKWIVNMYVEVTCDQKVIWSCSSSWDKSVEVSKEVGERNYVTCMLWWCVWFFRSSSWKVMITVDDKDSEIRRKKFNCDGGRAGLRHKPSKPWLRAPVPDRGPAAPKTQEKKKKNEN